MPFLKEVCNILYCLEVSWAIENLDAKIFRCKIMQSQMSISFLEYIPIIYEMMQKFQLYNRISQIQTSFDYKRLDDFKAMT